ncbi:MobH family relaxase [Methylococcus capsulatus]|uniref:MobH family relaxase n=1 Tax=Methylococcus capsulatus TaxID=414 RepID=UPI001C531704|nr:MobH family relaxase [Methylococcus capsulatus]QXP89484.1 TraI domain-containing protein [Methylococcus capsulatus]
MFGWLRARKQAAGGNATPARERGATRYPPFPEGIPAVPVDDILEPHRELIDELAKACGIRLTDAEPWIGEPVRHYASRVHLVPASADEYYRTTGGLLAFGLETARHALRYADRHVLSPEPLERRTDDERLWRHAVFLAAMHAESVRTFARLAVYAESGDAWHPGSMSLCEWIERNRVGRYHLSWSSSLDTAMMVTVAGQAIPATQKHLLAGGHRSILPTLMSSLVNPWDLGNPVTRIVESVRIKIIEKDLASDPTRYGKPFPGMHLSPWLIDAMRTLYRNRKWRPNEETLWIGDAGAFLVWPAAGHTLIEELRASRCPFVPRNLSVLAEILCDAGILAKGSHGPFLRIAARSREESEPALYEAVRLCRAEIVVERDEPRPALMLVVVPPPAPAEAGEVPPSPPAKDSGTGERSPSGGRVDASDAGESGPRAAPGVPARPYPPPMRAEPDEPGRLVRIEAGRPSSKGRKGAGSVFEALEAERKGAQK